MTRAEFLQRLRKGLSRLPASVTQEIMTDYEAHFADGAQAGRSEADVAAALGDPARLARELRAEAGLKRWEEEKNPSAAIAAIIAVVGLGALDLLILLPLLFGVVTVMIALFTASLAVVVAGGAVMVAGPFASPPGGAAAAILGGLGLAGVGIGVAALLVVITIWLVNALVWYGRLHFQLIKPALTQKPEEV
jgi:uncharacterized membrane protein